MSDKCCRCGSDLKDGNIMSMFNTDVICLPCKEAELEHPNYEVARSADEEAIHNGNYNFKGIGYGKRN